MVNQKENIFLLRNLLFAIILGLLYFQGNAQNSLVIDSVSLKPTTNYPIISWTLQTSATDGYIEVFRRIPGGTYGRIYTVPNLTSTSFEDNGVSGAGQTQSYFLAAFATGGATIATSQAHATIALQQLTPDFCTRSVTATWINYQVTTSFGIPVQQPVPFNIIRVQYSTDGVNFQTAASLPHPPISTEPQNHNVQVPGSGPYHFRIQAYNTTTRVTSSSNIRLLVFNPPQVADLAINYVDVVDNQDIRVHWNATGNIDDFNYHLFRNNSPSGVFEQVATLQNVAPFTDNPEISSGPWFYKVRCFLRQNQCPEPAFESPNDHSSIFLSADINLPESMIYADWQHESPTIWSHQLQQLENGTWQDVSLNPTGTNQGYFGIDLGQVAGTITMRIAAKNGPITIHSNHAVISIEPQIYIPNAFRPTSAIEENRIFKPIIPGYFPAEYQLIVFNRWGLKIFESNDKEIGWDGTINGSSAQPGTYPYLIRITGLRGETIERRGVVVLVF